MKFECSMHLLIIGAVQHFALSNQSDTMVAGNFKKEIPKLGI